MKPIQTYVCAILSLFILAAPAIAQDCTAQLSLYNCVSITSCMDTSGVCECANGNQCVWTNQGSQTVNCPCYTGTAYNAASSNCASLFAQNNCGYETTCNTNINTVTCRCPDNSTCIYNDSITLNCPCVGSYPDTATYKTAQVNECARLKTAHNCPSDPIHCMSGIGTCKCDDGSLCAWGPNYEVNCPCTSV